MYLGRSLRTDNGEVQIYLSGIMTNYHSKSNDNLTRIVSTTLNPNRISSLYFLITGNRRLYS
jgi:hypothetical protein